MSDKKITFQYILIVLISVLFTWVLHEFTHWAISELLGYESKLTLNSVSPVKGQELSEWHKIYISASGPIITILQAIVVYSILKTKGWNKLIYPLLFVPMYMRIMAGMMNYINPNDEGRISEYFGLGLYTISILVSGFLFFLVYKTSKNFDLNWKFNFWTTIIVIAGSSVLILSDQFLGVRLL